MIKGLGNKQRAAFVGIANGKVTYRPGKDMDKQEFDYVEGNLKEIKERTAKINGEDIDFIDFIFHNDDSTLNLSVMKKSGVARSIILSLMSVPEFSGKVIRISPYLKNVNGKDFTNVGVYVNGEKASWLEVEVPAVEKVTVGKKTYDNDEKRTEFIENLIKELNVRLSQASYSEQVNDSDAVDYDDYPADEPAEM